MKTLLIGFEKQKLSGYGELTWLEWAGLQPFNIGDFDAVLVNLDTTVSDLHSLKAYLQSVNRPKVLELLGNHGNLVYVGNFTNRPKSKNETSHYIVTALAFGWDASGGTHVEVAKPKDQNVVRYFRDIKTWDVAMRGAQVQDKAGLYDEYRRLRQQYSFEVLAHNKSGHAVAFYVHLEGWNTRGRIWFLPRPSVPEGTEAEAVLQLVCPLELVPAPAWTLDIEAPNQGPIDDEIVAVEAQIAALRNRHGALNIKREFLRESLNLLYQTGGALEVAVWRALRELGANVEEPEVKNLEDGWITVPGEPELEGVLEIKSTRNASFDEHGLNQVAQWVQRGIHVRERMYKPIYVGSAQVEVPVADRTDPFSDSFKKKAQMGKTVVLRCEDLFALLVENAEARLDRTAFWTALFATDGVFEVEPFIRKRQGATAGSPSGQVDLC